MWMQSIHLQHGAVQNLHRRGSAPGGSFLSGARRDFAKWRLLHRPRLLAPRRQHFIVAQRLYPCAPSPLCLPARRPNMRALAAIAAAIPSCGQFHGQFQKPNLTLGSGRRRSFPGARVPSSSRTTRFQNVGGRDADEMFDDLFKK
ncbi:uncharacterized protein [Elaeis guineensis]|uniref:uncharacterized protein n=1 Tax=Elaeis guineensis var. tenera TaxID=51953 RepID=UPI003C6D2999